MTTKVPLTTKEGAPASRPAAAWPERLAAWIERALPLAILAVAALLRLHRLDSVPEGLLWDEAYNGVDVLRILAGERPVFLEGNFGREALFIYLQALAVSLLGPTDLALRLVAALVGTLTVATSFLLVRRLFGGRVAMLACAWLALSIWHVVSSRIGLRTVSLPLFESAAYYCLWRGLSASGSKPRRPVLSRSEAFWYALAGLLLGLSLHTYVTARFVPLVVVALGGYLWLLHRPRLRQALAGLALSGVVAGLVFLPQAAFFVEHPEAFAARANAVSIFNPDVNLGGPLPALLASVARTLGMFGFVGDHAWDHNISGRPVFDPLSSALAALGLLTAVQRRREPAYAFVLLWLLVMLIPSVVAVRESPHFLRATGLIPAVFALPAIGLARLWDRWERRSPGLSRHLPLLLVSVGFALGSARCYRDYFTVWASAPVVAQAFLTDGWVATRAALAKLPAEAPILLGAGDADHPRLRYALAAPGAREAIRPFDGARSLILPPDAARAAYLFPASALPPVQVLEQAFPGQAGEVVARTPQGAAILEYRLGALRPELRPSVPVPARFGGRVEVAGFDVPRVVRAGETMAVSWYWRVLAPGERELAFSNQLFDAEGRRRGQSDARPFAPSGWEPGTIGVSTFRVPVDPGAESGPYTLRVAVYERPGIASLPVLDGRGESVGAELRLGPVKVHGRPAPHPSIGNPLVAETDDQIALLGYDLELEGAAGQELKLTLYWSARGRPSRDYTVFVHLLDGAGRLRAQADGPPRSGGYPTSLWDTGEVVTDVHRIVLGDGARPEGCRLAFGLYAPDTGRRLALVRSDGSIGDQIQIACP